MVPISEHPALLFGRGRVYIKPTLGFGSCHYELGFVAWHPPSFTSPWHSIRCILANLAPVSSPPPNTPALPPFNIGLTEQDHLPQHDMDLTPGIFSCIFLLPWLLHPVAFGHSKGSNRFIRKCTKYDGRGEVRMNWM